MGRKRTGAVYWDKHHWYARVWIGKDRPAFKLTGIPRKPELREAAQARATTMVELQAILEENGQKDGIEFVLEEAASARTDKQLARVRILVDGMVTGHVVSTGQYTGSMNFRQLGEAWTSHELHRCWPDYVPFKKSADTDRGLLRKWVYDPMGAIPVHLITLAHAEQVMRACTLKVPASRRHVAQVIRRPLQIAVYPMRIISLNPIPRGFLPPIPKAGKARSYLFPFEDAQLLGCTLVPLEYRMLYGVLAREGGRKGEWEGLVWMMLNLRVGIINLDLNKTNRPRHWALRKDVAEALRIWRGRMDGDLTPHVFPNVDWEHLAEIFRKHLRLAGIGIDDRQELYLRTEQRKRIVAHDLRATFVTLHLALGKSEAWIRLRTGHTTSAQLVKYQAAAQTVAELQLGDLGDMVELIPELAEVARQQPVSAPAQAPATSEQTVWMPPEPEVAATPTVWMPPEPEDDEEDDATLPGEGSISPGRLLH